MTSEVPGKPLSDKLYTRRRKRSSSDASGDSEFVLSGARRDEMSKHRSCVVHMVSYEHGEQATRKQAQEIEDEYAIGTTSDPASSQETDICTTPVPIPSQAKNMSSSSFNEHLEKIWRSFPTDKLVKFTYIECLWFGLYRIASQKTKVLSWIKKKDIFSRDYVFIPICCWSHWNLLILCHFSEKLDSKNKKPSMLLLDSLHMADPMRLETEIRKFVLDICKVKGISGQSVSKIPLLVPKVPQQKNKECGFFSLYFIKKFMETVLETICNDDLSFIDKDWFTREELDGFCIELEKESKTQRELEALTFKKTGRESREGDVIVLHED